jgi:ribonuclease Z
VQDANNDNYTWMYSEWVKGVDVIYHEATYDDAEQKKAVERGHSTAREAGRIAAAAGASKLILGHFSKRYKNENTHLAQAQEEFPDVVVANEGMKIDLL